MLFDRVNRHKRLGGLLIFLFIGLPMVFFIPGAAQFTFGSAPGTGVTVAQAGSTPVTAEEFYQRFLQAQDERQRYGQPATAQDLVSDGTVDAILDSLVNQALVKEQTKDQPVRPDDDFLHERLKEDPYFQNEQGEFDASLYNQWVQNATTSKFNWDAFFSSMADQINNDTYLYLIGASARVTQAEIRDFFNDRNTKLKVKAIGVEPTVPLTDEELRAFYDANLDQFMTPDERVAEYIAVSILPPVPPLVDEIIAKANAGEDFGELAKAHSESFDADSGGDLGWINESAGLREHEKVLFEMQPGEVRGPVRSVLGLHIYKVEEVRTDAQGNREAHARQILLRPVLDETEKAARKAQADALRAAAAAGNAGLHVAAADAGLEVKRTGRFSARTETIEGISEADSFQFRRDVSELAVDQLSQVIEGGENLFIAQVAELHPPVQRTFDEARADVVTAAERDHKATPEYQERVSNYVKRISEEATSVADVQAKFPELPLTVKETTPFGMDDMLFSQGLFIDTRQVFGRLIGEDVGSFTGPYVDMLRVPQFIELVEKTVPEGETWDAQFETEKAEIKQQLLATRQLQRRMDYMQYLVAEANDAAQIQKDYDLVFEILGLKDAAATTPASPLPAAPAPAAEQQAEDAEQAVDTPVIIPEATEGAPVESAPVEAAPVETAPAEEAPATPQQ